MHGIELEMPCDFSHVKKLRLYSYYYVKCQKRKRGKLYIWENEGNSFFFVFQKIQSPPALNIGENPMYYYIYT